MRPIFIINCNTMWRVLACCAVVFIFMDGCLGCNDVIIDDRVCNGSVVSGRTMSFPAAVEPHVSAGGPGSTLLLTQVAPRVRSTFGSSIKVKYGFVCLTNIPEYIEKLIPNANDPFRQWSRHAFCVDGMNDQGLSAAMLYQGATKKMPAYNSNYTGNVINFLDFSAFLLTQYKTVAEVKSALANMQVVWNRAYNKFGNAIAFGSANVTPLHVTVHDQTGASLVVQFNRQGEMEVLDNAPGVLANIPFLKEQNIYYQFFLDKHGYVDGVTPPVDRFYETPSDYSSPARYSRVRLMKTAAMSQCWSVVNYGETQYLSPGYIPEGYPSSAGTLHAVIGILNTVHLPRGYDDAGSAGDTDSSSFEVTHYITLRDHLNKVFYYRTGNSLLFRAVNLPAVDWSVLGGKFSNKPLRAPAQFWAIDDTKDVLMTESR